MGEEARHKRKCDGSLQSTLAAVKQNSVKFENGGAREGRLPRSVSSSEKLDLPTSDEDRTQHLAVRTDSTDSQTINNGVGSHESASAAGTAHGFVTCRADILIFKGVEWRIFPSASSLSAASHSFREGAILARFHSYYPLHVQSTCEKALHIF